MPQESLEPARDVRSVVLVVDDDEGLRESCRLILEEEFDVLDAPDAAQALETLRRHEVDVVLLDVRLPGMDGLEALQHIKALDEHIEVILVTAVRTVRTAVTAMKLGAFDYLTKPFEEEEVLGLVRRALERRSLQREVTFLRSELARREDAGDIVGQSPEMRHLFQVISRVARISATVLITGESGTGKELVARAIHRLSPRRERPFVPVNSAAISESLIESELFGHERGAFTGAVSEEHGRFELAQAGTLFLDEIGDISRPTPGQAPARAPGARDRARGRHATRSASTCASSPRRTPTSKAHGDAGASARISTTVSTWCRSPSLPSETGARTSASSSTTSSASTTASSASTSPAVSAEALTALREYDWPGNVRELQNIIERSVALVETPLIQIGDLPVEMTLGDRHLREGEIAQHPLGTALDQFERNLVQRVLERVMWNQSKAAAVLGLHRNTLLRKIAKWGLSPSNPD